MNTQTIVMSMKDHPRHKEGIFRIGSIAGIIGSLLAMVGNLLHPAPPSGDPVGVILWEFLGGWR